MLTNFVNQDFFIIIWEKSNADETKKYDFFVKVGSFTQTIENWRIFFKNEIKI